MLKKSFYAACASVVICLAVTLWIVPKIKSTRAAAIPEPVTPQIVLSSAPAGPPPSSQQALSAAPSPAYRVGEYEGNVAVFRFGETTPVQVLETPLSVLPEADRRLLREGITVMTEQELACILEDYS